MFNIKNTRKGTKVKYTDTSHGIFIKGEIYTVIHWDDEDVDEDGKLQGFYLKSGLWKYAYRFALVTSNSTKDKLSKMLKEAGDA